MMFRDGLAGYHFGKNPSTRIRKSKQKISIRGKKKGTFPSEYDLDDGDDFVMTMVFDARRLEFG